jgi:hypothetical protein
MLENVKRGNEYRIRIWKTEKTDTGEDVIFSQEWEEMFICNEDIMEYISKITYKGLNIQKMEFHWDNRIALIILEKEGMELITRVFIKLQNW